METTLKNANLKRKNSRLDQESNPRLQLYALALYKLRHRDDLLHQNQMFNVLKKYMLNKGIGNILPRIGIIENPLRIRDSTYWFLNPSFS